MKPMAPESIFHHICFQSIFTLQSLLSIYIIKIPKIFILLSLSDLTFASGREGIDNPFIALVARFLFVCVGTRRMMTHKCRGSIIVLSISKSVEPNEEQKEMISGFQQGILCKH